MPGREKGLFAMKNGRICSLAIIGPNDRACVKIDLCGFRQRRMWIIFKIGVREKCDRQLICVKLEQVPCGVRLCGNLGPPDGIEKLFWQETRFSRSQIDRSRQLL